ncbi:MULTISPECIES: hypothetical protein [Actinoplanes]|uniref:hypothetical protein n=1 Tax=Actinoplanes TaxID=1865 RepID=UPI0005F2E90E|nr:MULTISPECIES: hypothetical protein [Actinoplanes]GLY01709.1 MFS transporter [Actinoplanes sp. NBRC 101535]
MWARHRLEWITALLATVAGIVFLLLPPMGTDLAAQTARAEFFASHGFVPVDLRWYAGVEQFGYSLVSQPIMALFGVRVTGVLAMIAGSVLLAVLFRRTGAARPWAGALLGTLGFAGNLVSGRVTYGLGICLGVAALVLLTVPRLRPLAGAAAFLAAATSPVAGLFTGLAGAALVLTGRYRDGLLLGVPAALPLAVTSLLFGDGGWMNISRADTVRTMLTGLVVAAFVPIRAVRFGALLSSAGVLAAALIHTPVGLNATRLAAMFGVPVLAAYATLAHRLVPRPGAVLAVLIGAVIWWQQPVVVGDLRDLGNPTVADSYFRPLRDQLASRPLTGRVEIPPTRAYWEAASMGPVPLARGWLRQADIDRNPLFFTVVPGASGTGVDLTPSSYEEWLHEEAVQYVAVPSAELSWPGRAEAAMVTAGLPYLSLIWSDADWKLYEVASARPIVAAPATLVSQDAATLTFDAPAAGPVSLRIRHHRWFTASGGASVTADGEWTTVRVPAPGRYTVTSSLF